MADLIPFPRRGYTPAIGNVIHAVWIVRRSGRECANGMPGHPPCRSPAELEALLRARADVTAAREGV